MGPEAPLRSAKSAYLGILKEQLQSAGAARSVLETGVGIGVTALATAAMLNSGDTFHAVDLDQANIARLRELLAADPAVSCALGTLVQGDVRSMPFGDESVDVVCSHCMLAMLGSELDIALSECLRVLKPDGTLIVCEHSPPDPAQRRRRDLFLQVLLAARALRPEPYLMLPGRLVATIAKGVGFTTVCCQEVADDPEQWPIGSFFPLTEADTPLRDALSGHYHENRAAMRASGAVSDSFVVIAQK
jgi:SAM-dependent methyltransferase